MMHPGSRGGICQCRQCRWQCKIFASGVNFSIFTLFLCFFLLKPLKLGEIYGVKFFFLKIRRCKIFDKFHVCLGDFLRRLFATQHLWFGQTKYDLYYFRKCKGWLNSTLNAYVFFLQILTTLNSSYPNWLIKENLPKTNTIYADLEFVKCFTQERFSFLGPRRPLVLPLVDPSVCPPTLKIWIT